MNERNRNLAVGVTVIVALCMLGGMIVIFTGLPELFKSGYVVKMQFPSTAGTHAGDQVYLADIAIGRITDIGFTDNDPRKGVTLTARITPRVRVPGNVNAYIYTKGITGGAYLVLKNDGPPRINPATGAVMEFLPRQGEPVVQGYLKGAGLIPDELLTAVGSLTKLADNLNVMFTAPTETATSAPATSATQATTGPAAPPAPQANVQLTLLKLNRTLDALYAVVGDQQNQANIKASLANLNVATARAIETMDTLKAVAGNADAKVNDLSQKLIADAEQISQLMMTINKAAVKMEQGQGTLGQMINDPKLYNNLVDATQKLSQVMSDFKTLVEDWKKQGVKMKL